MKGVVEKDNLLRYLANLAINGHPQELGDDASKVIAASGAHPKIACPNMSVAPQPKKGSISHCQILLEDGLEGYANYVSERERIILKDTTGHDYHQSLPSTWMRTCELTNASKFTNISLRDPFFLKMRSGATFDSAIHFLHGCTWERLETVREKVTEIPFQILLRGANAMVYTNYHDNVVHKFCKQDSKSSVDVFRIFDSNNYINGLKLVIDAVGSTGGVLEGTIYYTEDILDPNKGK